MIDNNMTGIISSIMLDETKINLIEVGGNLRLDPHAQLGIRYYQLNHNPRFEGSNEVLLSMLGNDNCIFPMTLVINKEILNNSEILDAIREKMNKSAMQGAIRIADEGYILTREDYDKLSFASEIIVDNCVPELEQNQNVVLQYGIFKYDLQASAQPVHERRTAFDERVSRHAFHITHPLSEEEMIFLVQNINTLSGASIELDYYNPDYYIEFLNALQRHHVKENINIQFIGYLLGDQFRTLAQLQNYPYEIDIVYSTCHDMVELYQKEPYTENRLYYSQIEGGGKTSLENYLNVLSEVETFEEVVNQGNLSPLEAAVLAKIQIDQDYIYDPDADDVDEWDNINLSQIINRRVEGKRRAVCVGFSTLYSVFLRRVGIPMFRYSTTGHARNIGRIKDDKYDVDTICACDLTGDLQSDNDGLPTYTFSMVAPRDFTRFQRNDGSYEHMTIADTFALPMEEYRRVLPYTNLNYEEFYHPLGYEPMGYTARMLELMDEVPQEGMGIDVYNIIYQLCEEGHLEGISQDKILQAIQNVLNYLQIDQELIDTYTRLAETSFDLRTTTFDKEPKIGIEQNEYPVELLTRENVRNYRSQLSEDRPLYFREVPSEANVQTDIQNEQEDYQQPENEVQSIIPEENTTDYIEELIPGTNIHKPREREIFETDEEYTAFLRDYYERHFPHQPYLISLQQYVRENHTTIYDYYVQVAYNYRNLQEENLPAFERENPFVREEDIRLLINSEDTRMPLYFAGTLSRIIERNITETASNHISELFVDEIDKYNEEVGYRI